MKKYRKLLSKLLVTSKGKQLKLRPLASQFQKWLLEKGYEWDVVSTDKIVYGMRICIRSVRELPKDGKQFPKGYPELKTLTEKVILDDVSEKIDIEILPKTRIRAKSKNDPSADDLQDHRTLASK